MQCPKTDALWIKQCKNRFFSRLEHNCGSQKKGKLKTSPEWYFTHVPRHTDWGDNFEFWLVGWYCRDNHPRQILYWSVQGFWSSAAPNFPILHSLSGSKVIHLLQGFSNAICQTFVQYFAWLQLTHTMRCTFSQQQLSFLFWKHEQYFGCIICFAPTVC